MATTDPCSLVNFSCGGYNIGYIPINTDVVHTGELAITIDPTYPYIGVICTITSGCPEIQFDNGSGQYTQADIDITLVAGTTIYVPFQINVTACGQFQCNIKYEWIKQISEKEVIDCSAETIITAYIPDCDWQNCLTGTTKDTVSAVYCNPLVDCNDDICHDKNLQRLATMVAFDQIIKYKIIQKDWIQVNELYKKALNLCTCTANYSPCGTPDCGCQDNSNPDCQDCQDKNVGGCDGC